MYKWSVFLFLVFVGAFALAKIISPGSPALIGLIGVGLLSLILSFIFLLIDKGRADIAFLKKSWLIDKQYKLEKEAEKSLVVSTDEAKKRYRKARLQHILGLSSDDADGYITTEVTAEISNKMLNESSKEPIQKDE